MNFSEYGPTFGTEFMNFSEYGPSFGTILILVNMGPGLEQNL